MSKLGLTIIALLFSFQSAAAIHCFGTEPFWNATLSADSVDVNMMSGEQYNNEIAQVTGALGYQDSFMQVFSNLRGPVAIVKQGECSDGMSDRKFGLEAIIFTDLETLYGCCRERGRR